MKERSRLLRKNQTGTETKFWNIVRKRQFNGFRFHRQYVLHRYILDFVCFKKLLVIEFDGQQHIDNKEYDETRNDYLRAGGFTVLRFWNGELLQETERVLRVIYQKLLNFLIHLAIPIKKYLAPLPTCGRGARGSGGVGRNAVAIPTQSSQVVCW